MIATHLLLLAAAAAAAPASTDRRYSVTDFDRVFVEGPYRVTLTTGTGSHARATGSRDAIDRVSVTVLGRTLRVRPNRSGWGGYPGEHAGPVEITLSTRVLRAATVSGSGSLEVDRARGMDLQLGVEGNGRLVVGHIEADNLAVGLIGAGEIKLAGTAKTVRANLHGTGNLDAAALSAGEARIVTDTAGSVAMRVTNAATVTADGLGSVDIAGTRDCTLSGLSAGRVRCGGSDQR